MHFCFIFHRLSLQLPQHFLFPFPLPFPRRTTLRPRNRPKISTKGAEVNWGMEDDTGNLEHVYTADVPSKTPQPSSETPYL